MLYHTYSSDVDYSQPTEEEIQHFFPAEEDAIFALYEQLFHSSKTICKPTILNAMRYLVHFKGMHDQMEELKWMREEDLWITHEKEKEKSSEKTTQEIKNKLYAFLEEEII